MRVHFKNGCDAGSVAASPPTNMASVAGIAAHVILPFVRTESVISLINDGSKVIFWTARHSSVSEIAGTSVRQLPGEEYITQYLDNSLWVL